MGGEALVAARAAAWKIFEIVTMGMTLAAIVPWTLLSIPLGGRLPLALSVPPGLLSTALLAVFALTIFLLRSPSPPSPGLVSARLTAVSSPGILWDKQPLAALQETTTLSRPPTPD